VKSSKGHEAPGRVEPSLRFTEFIRAAAFLTGCIFPVATLVSLPTLLSHSYDWDLWIILAFVTLVPIWVGTLTVGGLIMIPVSIWRVGKRIADRSAKKTDPDGTLWDASMDGPEPQRP
jgi:hypothetical protein